VREVEGWESDPGVEGDDVVFESHCCCCLMSCTSLE
jgi:hypothetical protein